VASILLGRVGWRAPPQIFLCGGLCPQPPCSAAPGLLSKLLLHKPSFSKFIRIFLKIKIHKLNHSLTNQLINQSINQSTNQPASQPYNHQDRQTANQSINQYIINSLFNQFIKTSINSILIVTEVAEMESNWGMPPPTKISGGQGNQYEIPLEIFIFHHNYINQPINTQSILHQSPIFI